ncbi:MAG: succinate dehydrogenase, hydrophobic membrane anchor protein [Methylovulum sp.]|uniref:succinate dehydrogenase, hydrophobic membrane anchor protein n=1 Tax=Methylovulum sp. TaxID=1916980 RepID=UPI00261719A5|nr:succinate dehydrogenase, hydrophobic membrane anchor protein [Methylovulum sp.]MDD2723044.1 succinate dehydrogenase, hydrophobic membrane anchor protein [Methylovulum sp.]MDD5123767.1 succinate dehydrogenase, hydrophobic membrane anchor protein [Methylovulum sp.]
MDFRPPLARALGLGSAKTGTSHWWMQRVTAVALVPLSFPLIILLNLCINAPYLETVSWLGMPFNTVCIVAWILAVFYHAALGLQVVIEDYVANEGAKIIAVWAVNLTFLFLALAALLAVLRIILIG